MKAVIPKMDQDRNSRDRQELPRPHFLKNFKHQSIFAYRGDGMGDIPEMQDLSGPVSIENGLDIGLLNGHPPGGACLRK